MAVAGVLGSAGALGAAGAADAGVDPRVGSFGVPFVEPTVGPGAGYPRVRTGSDPNRITEQRCVERRPGNGQGTGVGGRDSFIDCKPAAGAMSMLPNGKTLYWDNLAGTENVEASIASEYGVTALNDQSRVLDVKRRRWAEPSPVDGGSRSNQQVEPFVPFADTNTENDASLFCADQNFLADGRLMAVGGTFYRNEPGNDQTKFGSTELNGAENARIFDPRTNRWTQTGSMSRGRWYPTMVTLADGRQFVASGVRKLIKPVNRPGPATPGENIGSYYENVTGNERATETYDPRSGRFRLNGTAARRSLPLFARLHLLPNGNVFYNAAGQSFSPEGQSPDEALWNIAATYDPSRRRWTELGIPGASDREPGTQPVDNPAAAGFRGSTFSVMLPLKAGRDGKYRRARFLTGGGVPNPPSPGGYFALRDSRITTVTVAGRTESMKTRSTSPMNPTSNPASGRWYGSGTLLPTGEVLVTSGADRDEVVTPGYEIAERRAEIFNPRTGKWRVVAAQARKRTYHNTANLMPDGRVLVGGHATITNAYTKPLTVPGGVTAPNDGRDPSFETYSPPYLGCGRRPKIKKVRVTRGRVEVTTDVPARQVESVVLMRNTSATHVVDADQRSVQLRVLRRTGRKLVLAQAGSGAVAPPGPYMLFANRRAGSCLVPSAARQVRVGQSGNLPTTRRARSPRRRPPQLTG
jgi:hypothetical protein